MAKEVRLPQLGQTMEEGTIVNCLINVGDEVKKGDVIFEIETDKATLEMEAPADGFVKHILVETDQTLAVGEPLIVLGDEDEEVPQSFVDSLTGGAPAAPSEAAPVEPAATTALQSVLPARLAWIWQRLKAPDLQARLPNRMYNRPPTYRRLNSRRPLRQYLLHHRRRRLNSAQQFRLTDCRK
jgi:pyruvate/2-oxoglutarate dehydrogenase complex dihydrolipoamide acyltransferase (E2) component